MAEQSPAMVNPVSERARGWRFSLRDLFLFMTLCGAVLAWFIHRQGDVGIQRTRREYDLAIKGHGFFQLLLPNGQFAYTRYGRFRLNGTGQLVTEDGFQLQPPVTFPNDTLKTTISVDGTCYVVTAGAPNADVVVGSVTISRFLSPAALRPLEKGSAILLETTDSGSPINGTPGQQGLGFVRQGELESMNLLNDDSLHQLLLGGLLVVGVWLVFECRTQRRELEQMRSAIERLARRDGLS